MKMLEQSGWIGVLIGKFGFIKVVGFGAALVGAAIMAVFRPPATRKELFMQGAVALGTSLVFGGAAVTGINHYLGWLSPTASFDEVLNFTAAVHGLIGACAWGVFGGLAVMRDRFAKDPTATIKEVKDAI